MPFIFLLYIRQAKAALCVQVVSLLGHNSKDAEINHITVILLVTDTREGKWQCCCYAVLLHSFSMG